MNESVDNLLEQLRGMWRKRWAGAAAAWVVGLLAATGLYFFSDRYEASARVYVDTQSVLKPLMAGLAFQPDIDQQVKMLARTLVSRPNVERLLLSPEIGLDPVDPKNLDRAVLALTTKIVVEPSGSNNLYSIRYKDTHPERATRLVAGLVKMFVSSSSIDKRKDSEDARNFIDEQILATEKKLSAAENTLKEFKLKNFSISGVSNQDYFARMSALSDEVNKLRLEFNAAEQTRDSLKRELASEQPQLPAEALPTPSVPVSSELDPRLEGMRRQLDDLLRRYTEEHPDVISTRRAITQLEAQRRQELDARAKLAAANPRAAAATNPVFQRLRIALAEAEANVASLRARLGVQQERLDEVRARASRVPEVEAELAQLNRDYEVIRRNYEQLVTRRESASLGVKLDQSAQLAEFRIIEPPRVSPTPVFPSRVMLAIAAALASIAAGALVAFGLSHLHPLVDGVRALRALSGRPVLGSVSLLAGKAMRSRRWRGALAFAGTVGSFVVAQSAWVAWIALRGGHG